MSNFGERGAVTQQEQSSLGVREVAQGLQARLGFGNPFGHGILLTQGETAHKCLQEVEQKWKLPEALTTTPAGNRRRSTEESGPHRG